MAGLWNLYFQWPVLPFSVLMCVVAGYWLLVILGALDLELFDFDLSVEQPEHVSMTDLGLLGLRWLNLGEVPFMIWLSIVTAFSWVASMVFDRGLVDPDAWQITQAIARNLVIGIVAAKLLTNPLKGKLRMHQPNTVEQMLGRTCQVISSAVTPEFGNGECAVEDGAPLRLHIRTLAGEIPKHSIVQLVDYDSARGVYIVEGLRVEG